MKLYKLSQEINSGYDTYDSVVVCAENEEDAKKIHPRMEDEYYEKAIWYNETKKQFWCKFPSRQEACIYEDRYGTWTNDLAAISTQYLGEADVSLKRGVILASFNAG